MSNASKDKRDAKKYVEVKRRLAAIVRVAIDEKGAHRATKQQLAAAKKRIRILETKVRYLDGCLKRKALWRRAGRALARLWRADTERGKGTWLTIDPAGATK